MGGNEKIAIGKIVSAVGLRGEVKIYPYSDNMARFEPQTELRMENGGKRVEELRFVKRMPVLKLEGVSDRNQAEALRGQELWIDSGELAPLPEGVYYVRELIGCAVLDESGARLGEIKDVIQNRAQDLYEIQMPDERTFLLPAVAAFVKQVDVAQRRVVASVPEGLMELGR
ncbi:MAG: ribosome maturation factor RimM [Clostridiales Family XIII bacterium]|jgi:16S rRNA processing protein RimM|nr:ribosome maturation factor RimM [Clostridiales Family XIII bacterium]